MAKHSIFSSEILLVMLCAILLVSPVSYFVRDSATSSDKQITPRLDQFALAIDPTYISINNDTEFENQATLYGWSGDGSSTTPYIIEDYTFDMSGMSLPGIGIENTRSHFIIRNCTVTNAWIYPAIGIALDNVTNGQIISNEITFNSAGMDIDNSNDILVKNNTFSSNVNGDVDMLLSTSITLDNNSFSTIYYRAVRLFASSQNNIINNTFSGGGIELECASSLVNALQIEVADNTVNGKPLVFLQDEVGGIVPMGAGQVILVNCSGVTVRDQVIDSAGHGIDVIFSDDTKVANNTVTGNHYGIKIGQSLRSHVYNNTCFVNTRDGIHIVDSDYAVVYNNTCKNNVGVGLGSGIYIFTSQYVLCENNTCTNNDDGIVLWSNTRFCTVVNNVANQNLDDGIYIAYSNDNNLNGNNIASNADSGISFYSNAYSNTITNNEILNNDEGVFLYSGYSNAFVDNLISENVKGLFIDTTSNDNAITANIFDGNIISAEDNGTSNTFDYNYWSDYSGVDGDGNGIGDTAHPISGAALNEDPHPLVIVPAIPIWVTPLANQVIEFGDSFTYDIDAIASTSILWSVDDIIHFSIDNNGVVRNATSLSVGVYPIHVNASSLYGAFIYESFTLTVQDTTPPDWVIHPTDQSILFGESLNYQLDATDLSGVGGWSVNDTIHFSIVDGLITSIGILEVGEYGLSITVVDIYNNPRVLAIKVIVLPSTITGDLMQMVIVLVSVGAVVVVLATIITLRRRR